VDHDDHVGLLREGVEGSGPLWADFGSGDGAFTLALADILGPEGMIYSLDRKAGALRDQEREMRRRFPRTPVHYLIADYREPLELPAFDGIVMANTLHYQTGDERQATLGLIRGYLRPSGRLVIVEYDREESTFWLPHPLPWRLWQQTAPRAGFVNTRKLDTRPSRHAGGFYSAVSERSVQMPD
jgi:ubiquinone/menaquinone biosynthesis C-methylase UbiE